MPKARRKRPGFVLVVVLGLLVLSATLLVAVSRASTRAALSARSAEEDLQRKWGLVSCRKAVLPYAEQMLVTLEARQHKATARYMTSVRLGGQTFELIIADEQAKANLNAAMDGSDVTRTQARLQTALSGTGLANRIKLRPTVGPVMLPVNARGAGPVTQPTSAPTTQATGVFRGLNVGGFGQVFDGMTPAQLIRPLVGGGLAPSDLMTFWGSGEINVRRASSASLQLAAGKALGRVEIDRLLDARNATFEKRMSSLSTGRSDSSPGELLKAAIDQAMASATRNRGNISLIQQSKCHSLWVVARTGRRDWYDLAVLDETDERNPKSYSFSW